MTDSVVPPARNRFARCHLGVDVGGTFTDLVLYLPDGELRCIKVPSTPADLGMSTLNGIDELLTTCDIASETWQHMHHTHSSTVATNALIERRGARIGMLTTAGFRDVFELQRMAIPHPMRFDSRRPTPLVSRALVHEVRGRVDVNGREVEPLDPDEVVAASRALVDAGVEVAVVCFLHSYRYPDHERKVRQIAESEVPGLRIELSSDVWPQAREFERATLTAVNAYIRPVVERYLDQLEAGLDERGIHAPARVARSNGGMELASTIRRKPAAMLLSGPAGGVTGAVASAVDVGWHDADLMTLDVGGTSADIGVVRDGRSVLSSEEHIADFPILIPTVAVSSIGAGGGSIVWVDATGSLKLGPRSVGIDPAPACYGLSDAGVPALTDAFLVAGFLAPGQRLGGKLALSVEPAEAALGRVGAEVGWQARDVADGAIRLATAMMAAETTNVLARRGVDAPRFRMVAFGGAGPLVGALLAQEVGIDSVLVPPTAGALSALGAARADLEGDLVRPVHRKLRDVTEHDVVDAYTALSSDVTGWLAEETSSLPVTASTVEFAGNMRYDGQGHDVTVPIDVDLLRDGDVDGLAKTFHEAHHASYGHSDENGDVWLMEVSAHVVGRTAKPAETSQRVRASSAAERETRTVQLEGRQLSAVVRQRGDLCIGEVLLGPAIVEQMDTTVLVPPEWQARVELSGSIILTRR